MDPRPDLSAAYDAHVLDREERGEPDWRAPHRRSFADRLPSGARVLEIGAGVGYTSRWFSDQGFSVVATDLSEGNVEKCREKGLTAQVADMSRLPFDDSSFDAVWAASCLMHIPNVELLGTLRSIERVLADGGWWWAGTWGGLESEGVWEDDWYRPPRFYSIRSDRTMRTAYEEVFEVVSFEVADPEPSIEWHYQMAVMRRAARRGGP